MVERIITLQQAESVRLDPDRLGTLYVQLGEANAEDVVCRAIEELAVRLAQCRRQWTGHETEALRKSARSMVAIADQIGMSLLARVARDVTQAIDAADTAAVGATTARLMRVGERSLTAVWDLHDMPI